MKRIKVSFLLLLAIFGTVAILSGRVDKEPVVRGKFRSYSELVEFLEEANYRCWQEVYGKYMLQRTGIHLYTTDAGSSSSGGQLRSPDTVIPYSGTNIQVQGVDEADKVKTDGEHIYVVSKGSVIIAKAYPPEEATILSRTSVDGTPEQIFIDDDRLVTFSWSQGTHINIYNTADKQNPTLIRNASIDGAYVASRMIGDTVFLVVKQSAHVKSGKVSLPTITYGSNAKTVSAQDVHYVDTGDYWYAFTTVMSLNITDSTREPSYETILSAYSSEVYVSNQNIYLAMTNHERTLLHRIHIEPNCISHVANGEVPGCITNQFSMDEYQDHLRIATTSTIAEPRESNRLLNEENNIFVLDMTLATVGKIEHIAQGEQIHSVRFIKERCYLVTFRKIDPFFVIDLSNSTHPTILGQLKITGFSDYMHPYDEDHIIGVGKETTAAESGDFSWHQGIKISLFDTTKELEPVELAKFIMGDRGSDSPVLQDHKAFLFDRESNLLAIPVLETKVDSSLYPHGVPPDVFGSPVWQGVYVFRISLEDETKIALRGKITHVEDQNVLDDSCHITRTLYIDDALYTVSETQVRIHSLSGLSHINTLNLQNRTNRLIPPPYGD